METRIDGRSPSVCDTLSVTYHSPGESGTGRVGPDGATILVLTLGIERSVGLVEDGLASRKWTALSCHPLAMQVLRESTFVDPDSDWELEELTLQLFHASQDRRHGESRRPRWWQRLEEVLDDIGSGYRPLETIAEQVGIHPIHLCSTYRDLTGTTIGSELRGRRVRSACRRILNTTDPLGLIAVESGFADQSHFIRSFRKTFGFRPSELRPLAIAHETSRLAVRTYRGP